MLPKDECTVECNPEGLLQRGKAWWLAFQVDCRPPSGFVQVACKERHFTLFCVQRHLVMPAPLRDACDGFLHISLGGQLAKIAAEQGYVI